MGASAPTQRGAALTSIHDQPRPSPILAWLSQTDIEIECHVIYEGVTIDELDVDTLDLGRAKRELVRYLVGLGYRPVTPWVGTSGQVGDYRRARRRAFEAVTA